MKTAWVLRQMFVLIVLKADPLGLERIIYFDWGSLFPPSFFNLLPNACGVICFGYWQAVPCYPYHPVSTKGTSAAQAKWFLFGSGLLLLSSPAKCTLWWRPDVCGAATISNFSSLLFWPGREKKSLVLIAFLVWRKAVLKGLKETNCVTWVRASFFWFPLFPCTDF